MLERRLRQMGPSDRGAAAGRSGSSSSSPRLTERVGHAVRARLAVGAERGERVEERGARWSIP